MLLDEYLLDFGKTFDSSLSKYIGTLLDFFYLHDVIDFARELY